MDSKEVLAEALRLKPEDRFLLVEGLLKSLDEPDQGIDAIWAEEAEKRLRAYRAADYKAYRRRTCSGNGDENRLFHTGATGVGRRGPILRA